MCQRRPRELAEGGPCDRHALPNLSPLDRHTVNRAVYSDEMHYSKAHLHAIAPWLALALVPTEKSPGVAIVAPWTILLVQRRPNVHSECHRSSSIS